MSVDEENDLKVLIQSMAEIPECAWEKIKIISGNPRLGMSTAKLVVNDKGD